MNRIDNPKWWNDSHESSWERVKAAFSRDWEQTKNDFGSDTSRNLQQSAADTVKQAVGVQPLPGFAEVEPALRYGHGAKLQHAGKTWNDELESELETDYPGDWGREREFVKRGFNYSNGSQHM